MTTYLGGKPLAPSEGEGNSGRGQNSPTDKWSKKTSPGAQAAVGGRGTEDKGFSPFQLGSHANIPELYYNVTRVPWWSTSNSC